jgi:uncharacterized protein YecT (DUF1311 family)
MQKISYFRVGIFIAMVMLLADSFAIANEREECRSSKDREKLIQCIERGVYDPCEDAGGKWGEAQCAGAHTDIAERRIKKAENELALILKSSDAGRSVYEKFQESQKIWLNFRESYCQFTNAADDLKQFGGQFLHSGYCWRRLTEQRADELESVLKNEHEKSE